MAIGGNPEANALSLKLAEEHPGRIFGCAGYDRDEAAGGYDLTELRGYLEDPMVKAVGETGLDYYYTAETAPEQKKLFAENLALAAEFRKPVVVHTRDADEDTAALLSDYARDWPDDPGRLGVLHCFTRGTAFARQVLDLEGEANHRGSICDGTCHRRLSWFGLGFVALLSAGTCSD